MILGVLLDLDGTVYRGTQIVPGAREFCEECRKKGVKILFVTNNATRRPDQIAEKLLGMGIPCRAEQVLTASQVAAKYIGSGKVYYIGEEGLRWALEQQGLDITATNAQTVVVGLDREVTYQKLDIATRLIRGGARFVATNADSVLVTETGLAPGGGAIVAAVERATGITPVVIGKPEPTLFITALELLRLERDQVICVGDNLETDIAAGARAGLRTVLMLGGVSKEEDVQRDTAQPTWVIKDFQQLLALITQADKA